MTRFEAEKIVSRFHTFEKDVDERRERAEPGSRDAKTYGVPNGDTQSALWMVELPFIRLLPLDVGFDLRVTKHQIEFPACRTRDDNQWVVVQYMDDGTKEAEVCEPVNRAAKILRKAGYVVAQYWKE